VPLAFPAAAPADDWTLAFDFSLNGHPCRFRFYGATDDLPIEGTIMRHQLLPA
jgi:hypothetical protein